MTRADDLAGWLKQVLGLQETFVETAEAQEALLPGALIRFRGVAPPRTLSATRFVERYLVVLLVQTAGGNAEEIAADLATSERRLLRAARGPERAHARWTHLEARRLDAEDTPQGASPWEILLTVEGE